MRFRAEILRILNISRGCLFGFAIGDYMRLRDICLSPGINRSSVPFLACWKG